MMSTPSNQSTASAKITCVVCQEDYDAGQILFRCTKCKSGYMCRDDTIKWLSTWRDKAIQNYAKTVDTDQQVLYVYAKAELACPVCKNPADPGAFDPSMAWYKTLNRASNVVGMYALISANLSHATLD